MSKVVAFQALVRSSDSASRSMAPFGWDLRLHHKDIKLRLTSSTSPIYGLIHSRPCKEVPIVDNSESSGQVRDLTDSRDTVRHKHI